MCRRLGQDGIRGELLDACRKNIVGSAALVKTGEELKNDFARLPRGRLLEYGIRPAIFPRRGRIFGSSWTMVTLHGLYRV